MPPNELNLNLLAIEVFYHFFNLISGISRLLATTLVGAERVLRHEEASLLSEIRKAFPISHLIFHALAGVSRGNEANLRAKTLWHDRITCS